MSPPPPAMSSYNFTQYLMFQLQRLGITCATVSWKHWIEEDDQRTANKVIQVMNTINDTGTYADWFIESTVRPMPSANVTNGTTEWQGMNRTLAELVMGTITFLVITVMTCVGNSLVVLSVFTYRPLKKVQNYFIVSLAVADGMVAILVMPFHLVKFLMRGQWLFGLAVCQMWLTFDILCCTASILNLTAIAIDRYWAIHNPIEYANKRTFNLVMSMITIVWVLSALISIPPLIGWNDWSTEKLLGECELTSDPSFVVYSASGSFFIPLLVMSVVYVKIFVAARERILKNRDRSALTQMKKGAKNNANANADNPGGANNAQRGSASGAAGGGGPAKLTNSGETTNHTSAGNESSPLIRQNTANNHHLVDHDERPSEQSHGDSGDHDNNGRVNDVKPAVPGGPPGATVLSVTKQREKISVSKEKKAAKTLAVIMGVFVLCWLPFFLMYVILPFCEDSCYLHPKVMEAITWLGYINSAINPVIYTIFNMDFRRAFEKLICPSRSRDRRH